MHVHRLIQLLCTRCGQPTRTNGDYRWQCERQGRASITINAHIDQTNREVVLWIFDPSGVEPATHLRIRNDQQMDQAMSTLHARLDVATG